MSNNISELYTFLEQIKPGPVANNHKEDLESLLMSCWEEFIGSEDSKMEAYKLERMEDPEWEPPILSFTIERHGGAVRGSTRAEKQAWVLDLNERRASNYSVGYKQIKKRAKSWQAKPVGEELAQKIINGDVDSRLEWLGEGKNKVKVLTPSFVPDYYNGPKETTRGRITRFYNVMGNILCPKGWQRSRNIWSK